MKILSLGFVLLAAATLAAGCSPAAPEPADGQTYTTESVRMGDITFTASGTGVLTSSQSAELSFPVSGTISKINVQEGDEVTQGQVLAALEEISELKRTALTAELDLDTAQEELDSLLEDTDRNLAQALAERAAAQEDYQEAQDNLRSPGESRCSQETTENYYYDYLLKNSEANLWDWYLESGTTGYGMQYIQSRLVPLRRDARLLYLNFQYCQGYTGQEILDSQAVLESARAALNQAEKYYQELLDNSGVDASEVAIAQARVESATKAMEKAESDLEGATLTAPMDGTVVSLNAGVGNSVKPVTAQEEAAVKDSMFITIADLSHPALDVFVDEADMQALEPGCTAQVSFSAIPDRVINGTVTQVDPVLTTFNEYSALWGRVDLGDAELMPGRSLPLGISGTVSLVCTKASRVLVAPLTALETKTDGSAIVFVLNAQGEPEERSVEVGSKNTQYAEIRSGLQAGEQVITDPYQVGMATNQENEE